MSYPLALVICLLIFFVAFIGIQVLDNWHARRAWRRADQRAREVMRRMK